MLSFFRLSGKKCLKKMASNGIIDFVNLRMELNKKRRIVNLNSAVIRELLKGSESIKLELGAGDRRIEGWTSVDITEKCDLTFDLTAPIPFPDNTVSMIYSSHVLEHFKYSELIKLLGECLRILKPGGSFSASVPNARIYLEAYHNSEGFNAEKYCGHKPAYNYNSKIDYVNYMAYMDGHHQYMFDEENIIIILKKAGFKHVMLRDFDKAMDLEVRNFQSIYFKAEK